jgi:SHAQKYF class myb-like DNA-binding protein
MSLVSPVRANGCFELSAFHNNTSNNIEPKFKCSENAAMKEDVSMDDREDDDEEEEEGTVGKGVWTKEEHTRFLEAIKIYANGPWKLVAAYVATRTVRQTMTHAQKYRQKAARRLRGLRTKQALMRMHYGHRISEESLIQERLRTLAAQVESPSSSPGPLYTPSAKLQSRNKREQVKKRTTSPSPKTPATSPVAAKPSGSFQALLDMKVECESASNAALASTTSTAASSPTEISSVSCIDASSLPELDIIDDLSEAPSLEECAEMLYDLLC